MPKFIKLKLNGLPSCDKHVPDIQWRLVIDNIEDLNKYHSLNATLNMQAFMNMEKDEKGNLVVTHVGCAPVRDIALQKMLSIAVEAAPEGEKIYPIVEVAKITDKKYLALLKHITTRGAIQMNEAGGYCGLEDFIKQWDCEILEEIEKESFGFPTEDAIIEADTLVLENAFKEPVINYLQQTIKKDIPAAGNVQAIYNLREKDTSYVFKCLSVCKNVVIQTELQDDSQLNSFMSLFKKLPPKNIYLYVNEQVQQRIMSHEDYPANSTIHNITFK